jgi:hypothetical protein
MQENNPTNDRGGDLDCFGVIVKAPAGYYSAFAVRDSTTPSELIKRSVDYFVARKELEGGEFEIALIRDPKPIPLEPDKPLGVYDVVEGDVLHLVSSKPFVDG